MVRTFAWGGLEEEGRGGCETSFGCAHGGVVSVVGLGVACEVRLKCCWCCCRELGWYGVGGKESQHKARRLASSMAQLALLRHPSPLLSLTNAHLPPP